MRSLVTGLFHLAQRSGLTHAVACASTHSFLRLRDTAPRGQTTFPLSSRQFPDPYVVSHFLAIMSNAAMNICTQWLWCGFCFDFSRAYLGGEWLTHVTATFSPLRSHQTVFQSSCTLSCSSGRDAKIVNGLAGYCVSVLCFWFYKPAFLFFFFLTV